jgi:hypothetical protein
VPQRITRAGGSTRTTRVSGSVRVNQWLALTACSMQTAAPQSAQTATASRWAPALAQS